MAALLKLRDITPGMVYQTPGIVVTESHILAFAGIGGDFFAIHVDDVAAREKGFPARVAHGLLGLTLVDGLKNRSDVQFDGIASLEWHYRFLAPVFAGDRLQARIEVLEKRPTSDGLRGIVKLGFAVSNQKQERVQEGSNLLLVHA
jgi:acyl dehydratase